jgi:DNA ligase-1
MKHLASLIDHLTTQKTDKAKIRLLADYFKTTPDPDRGYAAALLSTTLTLPRVGAKDLMPKLQEQVDPVLFDLSDQATADKVETLSLLWPANRVSNGAPTLADLIPTVLQQKKGVAIETFATLFGHLSPSERWTLLKLTSGRPVAGVSPHLVRQSMALLGSVDASEVAEVWHSQKAPYLDLFGWLEGRTSKPQSSIPAPFSALTPLTLIDVQELASLDRQRVSVFWQPPGHRALLRCDEGTCRLYSAWGDDISEKFPELVQSSDQNFRIEGWLVTGEMNQWDPIGVVEKRLRPKRATKAAIASNPASLLCFDPEHGLERVMGLKPVDFEGWKTLLALRENRQACPTWAQGLILRCESARGARLLQLPLAPYSLKAVLLYFERTDEPGLACTLGVWMGDALVPVGKAQCSIDSEIGIAIDRFAKEYTTDRFGPVREVRHDQEVGLVVEASFDSVEPAPRRKAGLALRGCEIRTVIAECAPSAARHIELLQDLL